MGCAACFVNDSTLYINPLKLFCCGLLLVLLSPLTAQPGLAQPVPLNRTTNVIANSRQDILTRFSSERNLLVVYGASSEASSKALDTALRRSSWGRWRTNLILKPVDEVTESELSNSAVLLVGTPAANPYIQKLTQGTPLTLHENHFSFSGKAYQNELDVLTFLHPNPVSPGRAMYVITGFDENAIQDALSYRLRNHDYQVLRGNQRIRIGNFSQEQHMLWQHDSTLDEDFEDDIVLVGTTDHFRFFAHRTPPNHSLLSEIIMQREKNHDLVAAFQGANTPLEEPITYMLYASLEEKAVVTNSMEFAHVDTRTNTVHVALQEGIRGDQVNKDALILARSMIGSSPHRVFEDGLGLMISNEWFDLSIDDWMARISHADFAIPASTLLDNTLYQQSSALLREPLAAGFVSCLINEWGPENFLDNFSTWNPTVDEMQIVETVWSACLEESKKNFVKPVRLRKQDLHDGFQKGFNFAHEGYGIVDGYGSKSANAALGRLNEMGSNAISLIPYTGMRDAYSPVPFRFSNTVGDENDGAVAHAARYAQAMDFTVMLKPQIWIRGSWPGDLDMQSDQEWDMFFDYYENWISHYAVLAELFEIDIFCIGTELTQATLKHEERWVDLANRIRSLYSGQLVYASNWGQEYENLSFWEAFDYIGLNSYYPLSDNENPSEDELREGAKQVVKRIHSVQKQFNKPLLLTEIGFPSTEKPWMYPWEENRQHPPNMDHQALCYEIMIETLASEEWLAGIYWWKWPSYLERGGEQHRDRFTPNGKPAEHVVSNWFTTF